MASVIAQLAKCQFTVPQGGDKVYKDECMFCFDAPTSDGGIYVCLSTLFAVCEKHLKLHVEKRRKTVFLHLKKIPKEVIQHEEGSPPEKKPTKLAIGVEGGFDVDQNKIEYEDENSLVVTDEHGKYVERHRLPEPNLPLNVQLILAAVLSHQGAALQDETKAWEDKRIVSKHAGKLEQLNNGVKIPPKGWKCAMCDLTQNLWLNLTDGTILCGRTYFDGSGGNNHALEYYQKTKYPLAVKLGTISAEGGDVYSYDEDDMVEDPKLVEHLKHFGISVSALEKSDKTMAELEIEANLSLKAEWDAIQEAGEKLTPLYGPGYTGMVNLGNSCYMNSVMQTLFSIDEFLARYADRPDQIFSSPLYDDPAQDFNVQMAKLGCGLSSGYYSLKPNEETESFGIRPQMIKTLVGKGHPEFSTNHQQDVHEYFLHLMDVIEKNETGADKIQDLFKFQLEERVECSTSHKVRYNKTEEFIWALPIPLDAATNISEYHEFEEQRAKAEANKSKISSDSEIMKSKVAPESEKTKSKKASESVVRLKIPMEECFKSFASSEIIDDFYSSAIKAKTTAKKITRFSTFPDYLVIQLQKFTISEDWTPKKLDVSVDMSEIIDLTEYLSAGLQPGEEELPEDGGQAAEEPQINDDFVSMLMDMGFPREACRKAVYHTNNLGVEAAMNWVFEHSQDADFACPLQINSNQSADPSAIAMIVSMGFTDAQARKALGKTSNNIEAAAEWIFTHGDELDSIEVDEPASSNSSSNCRHGEGKYQLMAFISHMGTSTSCGHYVCHIVKDGRWVIFNDRKVAVSVNPPKDLGYLYFYKRISQPT